MRGGEGSEEFGGGRTVQGCGGRDAGNDEENASKIGVAVEEKFRGSDGEEREGAQGCKGEGPVVKLRSAVFSRAKRECRETCLE